MANTVYCDERLSSLPIDAAAHAPAVSPVLRRVVGVLVGLGTQLIFMATVVWLFRFLQGTWPRSSGSTLSSCLSIDSLLCLQFALPHSVLLHPVTRRKLTPWIGRAFYGCFFCVITCLNLWVVFVGWQSSDIVLIDLHGLAKQVVVCLFGASWAALFYSLSLNGLGYQTGWTPFWYWLCRRPEPRREFRERGAYRWFRHPIYLSFLGLLWFTPRVTLDRALLIAIWSVYIYVGSILKDRRLSFYLGAMYREYAARVPGYPGLTRGPLGRLPDMDTRR